MSYFLELLLFLKFIDLVRHHKYNFISSSSHSIIIKIFKRNILNNVI